MVGGSAVHLATEALDKADFGLETGQPKTFVEAFEQEIQRREEDSGIPKEGWRAAGRASKDWPEAENEKWWLANGQSQVNNWRSFLKRSNYYIWITPEGVPAIEIAFTVDLYGPTVGYIDRIMESPGAGIGPVDLKSGASDPASDDQLGLYALAIEDTWGISPTWGAYFRTRKPWINPAAPMESHYDGRHHYKFKRGWDQIKAEIYIPSPSRLCSSCDVRRFCYQVQGIESEEYKPW